MVIYPENNPETFYLINTNRDNLGNRKKQKPEVDPKDLDAELEAYNAARAKKKDDKKDQNDTDPLSKDPPTDDHDDILAAKGDYP